MWKEIRTAAIPITMIVIWYVVVTLGFGSQVWPLFEELAINMPWKYLVPASPLHSPLDQPRKPPAAACV
jgi:hypothetical protein